MELEIEGDKSYLKRMKKHLEKEHPTTRGRMKIENDNEKGFGIRKKFLNKLTGGLK
jgi:hypothetical protein